MNVELLLVSDCPHASAARALLADCGYRLGLHFEVRERVGEYPSPTILVDGVDVMTGVAGTPRMQACRLDVPTASRVLAALRNASATPSRPAGGIVTTGPDMYPPELAVGVTSRRIAAVSAPARVVHQAILRGFADTGHAPEPATLVAATPAGHDVGLLLAELHDHDVIRLDRRGRIRAAYPFSAVATVHMVTINGGPRVFAMCAIDALGVAAMLGRDTTITSTDPHSGVEIRVEIRSGHAHWIPDTAVVVVGSDTTAASPEGDCSPPGAGVGAVAAADRCCGVMNFFASPDTAGAWMGVHPEVSGVVLAQAQAVRLGVETFGHLLDDGPVPEPFGV